MIYVLLAVLALVAVWGVVTYNRLVGLRVRSQNAWSDIDVQLKRRADLVPNLVETVRGYASHESGTLQAVTDARSRVVAAQGAGPAERAEAEGQLTAALRSLSVVVEAYPQLQAAGGFRDLQAQLSQLEDAIGSARRYYNAIVRDLNTAVMQLPAALIAGPLGFRPREFFEAAEADRAVPQVRF
jgi:LemA protein